MKLQWKRVQHLVFHQLINFQKTKKQKTEVTVEIAVLVSGSVGKNKKLQGHTQGQKDTTHPCGWVGTVLTH